MRSSKLPINPIQIAQILFCLNAFIWLLLSILSLLSLADNNPAQITLLSIIAFLMFGNAGAMLAAAWLLGKQQKKGYLLAIIVLLINVILTLTDQFGIIDLITLIIDLVILGIIIVKRNRFFPHTQSIAQ